MMNVRTMASNMVKLLLLCIMLVVWVSPPGDASMSVSDQAKVAVSFDFSMDTVQGVSSIFNDALKMIKNQDKAEKVAKFTKIARLLTKFLGTAISADASLVSFVSTFYMPSQLEVIQKQCSKVQEALTTMDLELNSVRDEMNTSTEFNAWITSYIVWELDIRNGENKLTETKSHLTNLDDEVEKLIIMEGYIDYFENQDIEEKAKKIHQLTGIQSTATKQNLFSLYVQETRCDVFELSQLMLIISDLMTSTAKQTIAYQFFKYKNIDYVREKIIIFSEIRKMVQEIYVESDEALSSSVQERLTDLIPWYEWTVAIYSEDAPKIIRSLCGNIPLNAFMSKKQFMIIKNICDDNETMLVVWQDKEDRRPGCQFTPGLSRTHDPCKFCNVCSNHGVCRHIPYTNDYVCFCDHYYYGDNCEIYEHPGITHSITDVVADMRMSFARITGVPTVIDVYAQIVEIKLMHKLILNANVFTQILIQYGEVFREAEYITYEYNKLKTFTLSKEMFLKKIMNRDFLRILSGLERAILGKRIFISHDFLSVYKKKIISELDSRFACTQNYSVAVLAMVDNLLIIDEVVTEASILLSNWQLQHLRASEEETLDAIRRTQNVAEHRWEKYFTHWEATSCTVLTADDLQEKYCGNIHSYQGLQVFLNCENNKQASTSSVTCTRRGNTLQWSETPQCQYMWSSWGSWGSCTKTCGEGVRSRARSNVLGDIDTTSESCNQEDCCQEKFGNFKCSNDECVSLSLKCDGNQDCSDGSDEARTLCPYLRSGDTVAFKSLCGGFLSGYRTYECDLKHHAHASACPGEQMDGVKWDNCWAEALSLWAIKRDMGDAVRYGDKVAIRYSVGNGDKGWWISCPNADGTCTTNSCPRENFTKDEESHCLSEVFRIYTPGKEGSCSSDTTIECSGMPLYPGNTVFILSRHLKYWLSSMNNRADVYTKNCPYLQLNEEDTVKCKCEQWLLFRK